MKDFFIIKPNARAEKLHRWFALSNNGMFGSTPFAMFLFFPIGFLFLLVGVLIDKGALTYVGIAVMVLAVGAWVTWAKIKADLDKRREYRITNFAVQEVYFAKNKYNPQSAPRVQNQQEYSFGYFRTVTIYQNFFARLTDTYCVYCYGTLKSVRVQYIAEEEARFISEVYNAKGKEAAKIIAQYYGNDKEFSKAHLALTEKDFQDDEKPTGQNDETESKIKDLSTKEDAFYRLNRKEKYTLAEDASDDIASIIIALAVPFVCIGFLAVAIFGVVYSTLSTVTPQDILDRQILLWVFLGVSGALSLMIPPYSVVLAKRILRRKSLKKLPEVGLVTKHAKIISFTAKKTTSGSAGRSVSIPGVRWLEKTKYYFIDQNGKRAEGSQTAFVRLASKVKWKDVTLDRTGEKITVIFDPNNLKSSAILTQYSLCDLD